MTALGYRYTLEREENEWWLVRFPDIPEALTEGEMDEEEAHANARDCGIVALEGYRKAGRPLPSTTDNTSPFDSPHRRSIIEHIGNKMAVLWEHRPKKSGFCGPRCFRRRRRDSVCL